MPQSYKDDPPMVELKTKRDANGAWAPPPGNLKNFVTWQRSGFAAGLTVGILLGFFLGWLMFFLFFKMLGLF